MKFLVDAQLPPALAQFLRSKGHEAKHVLDIDLVRTDDTTIWNHACQSALVIITKDDDFRDRVLLSEPKTSVVLLHVGNCSNRALLQWFAPLLSDIVEQLQAGERLIELA